MSAFSSLRDPCPLSCQTPGGGRSPYVEVGIAEAQTSYNAAAGALAEGVEAESSSQRAAAADDGAISQSVSALDRNVLRVSSMFASTSETAVSKNSPATRALAGGLAPAPKRYPFVQWVMCLSDRTRLLEC